MGITLLLDRVYCKFCTSDSTRGLQTLTRIFFLIINFPVFFDAFDLRVNLKFAATDRNLGDKLGVKRQLQ